MSNYIAQPYIASSPHSLVSGANVEALSNTTRHEILQPLLEEFGFAQINRDQWYSQQDFLTFIQQVEQRLTWEELVAIGRRGAHTVILPPDIHSFEDILNAIVMAYGLNHRHTPEDEGYTLSMSQGQTVITCNIPYPSFILFGYVHGLVERFQDNPRQYMISFDDSEFPYKIIIKGYQLASSGNKPN